MDEQNVILKEYINKINKILPYSKKRNNLVLERLESDILDALRDAKSEDPINTFGDIENVARNVSAS